MKPVMPTPPPSPAARLRALKRHVWPAQQRYLATCAPGIEDLLAVEVARLPEIDVLTRRTGAVAFAATFDTLYAALLRLRLAESLRVVLLHDVAAGSFPMLFDQLQRFRWPLWLPDAAAVRLRVKSTKSRLRDEAGLERTLRRALEAAGLDADATGAPPLTLHLHLHHDRATVTLDAGGQLHRRSGDKWVSPTTIRETTAAALCRLAGVGDPSRTADLIVDPFCGSGTVVLEALEALSGAAAGRRRGFPLEGSPAWKPERFAHARRLHGGAGAIEGSPPVLAFDADPAAVRATNHNLEQWGYTATASATVTSAQNLDLQALARDHAAARPLLLANPPYGKGSQAAGTAPADLLRTLLARASGWDFALLYPRPEELEGLPAVTVREVRSLITGGLRNAIVVGSAGH